MPKNDFTEPIRRGGCRFPGAEVARNGVVGLVRFIFHEELLRRRECRMGLFSEGLKLSVAIPASVIADVPHLREKTGKLGTIARACSIFGVSELILYRDDLKRDQTADLRLCEDILTFVETPQYLRKRLFRLSPDLRFIGILPPLQTLPHGVPRSTQECKVGDVREGVVVGKQKGLLIVDVGLQKQFECNGNVDVGTRVTIEIEQLGKNPRCKVAEEAKIRISREVAGPTYWGYRVRQAGSLEKFVSGGSWDLRIGTSRYGDPVHQVLPALSKALKTSQSVLLVFGSPRMGLREILAQEKIDPRDVFQYFVNTIPNQQTATVRTEEAILISLGVLNSADRLAQHQ